jgi:FemAB-related protein (PEP-CTERM system-associated)
MRIRLATPADRSAWDAYVLAHPAGIAYQLLAWKDAVEGAYGFQGLYLLAENGTGICGVLPLIDFRVPLRGHTLSSLPYCDVGGVLADDEEAALALLSHARALAIKHSATCQVRAAQPLPWPGKNQTDKVRMVLDLPADSEQLLAGLKSKLRSQVKKPTREGLTAKLGGLELVDTFYPLFAHNMRDLGSPVHSRHWIEAVVAGYQDRARIAVVYMPDGQPAAAGIVLLHPQTVSIPWASALREYNRMNPNMLLYWTFLSFAADNGFRQFDFGRSTPGEGTYRFKEQWGAQPRQLFWYELAADLETDQSTRQEPKARQEQPSSNRDLAASLWRRLPVAGANLLGPRIRKYISL